MPKPNESTPSTTLRLVAMIVGQPAFGVRVDRNAPIPTLLDAMRARMLRIHLPRECTEFTAFTTQRQGRWLHMEAPEYDAIKRGDARAGAVYMTSASQLDPTKTVADYFGDAPTANTVHMMLEWSAGANACYQAILARERAQVALFRQQRQAAKASTANKATTWWEPIVVMLGAVTARAKQD